ncbi:MAG: hypothetical protein ACTSQE_16145 [Candidatus Heimdallarchaeaceae archaeon]
MRYKLLTNALFVLGFSLLFILPSLLMVKANTGYPKKIDLVNQLEFIGEFDSQHCEIDLENKRLFLSHNGLKIYNISDPLNLQLLHESSYQAHGKIKYHNGFLYTINVTNEGQVIRVYTVTNDNVLVFVNESVPFDYADFPETYVNELFITDNDLLFTFGVKVRCWDISNFNNISCLFSSPLDEMFFDYYISDTIDFAGVAFHPNETKFLLAGNYREHQNGEIHLFDYSNPINISRIDFSLETFNVNESRIRDGLKNGLISNSYNPCFGTSSSSIEIINWTSATQPVFGKKFNLPSRDDIFWHIKLALFKDNQVLIYNILSGLIDISNFDDINYLTEYDGSKLNFKALREPQIINDFIFFLEDDFDYSEGHKYYLSIHKVNDTESITDSENKNLAYLAFISLILLLIPIIYFKKTSKKKN